MTEQLADKNNSTGTDSRTPPAASSVTCHRRRVLKATGAIAAAGVLAGCAGLGNDGPSGTGDGNPDSVDEWLSNTGNYESIEDFRTEDSVTVKVGAQGNNGANAFEPAAIRITPGTTVVWDWVSGYHNVVATDGTFDSGSAEEDGSFERTFEATGTFYYYCAPHRSIGMKGAVVVESVDVESAWSSGI